MFDRSATDRGQRPLVPLLDEARNLSPLQETARMWRVHLWPQLIIATVVVVVLAGELAQPLP